MKTALLSSMVAGCLVLGACSKASAPTSSAERHTKAAQEPTAAKSLPDEHPVAAESESKSERSTAERVPREKKGATEAEAGRPIEAHAEGGSRVAPGEVPQEGPPPREGGSPPTEARTVPPAGTPAITEDHGEVIVFCATDRAEEQFTFLAIAHRLRWAIVALLVLLAAPWLHRVTLPRWERFAIAGTCLSLGAIGSQCGLLEIGALLVGLVSPILVKPSVRKWFIGACAIGCVALTYLSIRATLLAYAFAERVGTSYGNGHRNDESLAYGACVVTIPKTHRVAVLESPSLTDFSESFERHVVLKVASPSTQESWRDCINAAGVRSAFVFIHGYNVSFETAARRTAQIANDLEFACTPIMYSWRSAGGMEQYTRDENAAEQTQRHLRQFLDYIADSLRVDEIHLVAHSMGNRALCHVLAEEAAQTKPRFHEVVLAAPDIDARVFRNDLAPRILGNHIAQRITLYASSKDLALQASKSVHGDPRAGESGEHMVVMDGIDTIDVTDLRSLLLGHSYIADNDTVLHDLRALLLEHAELAARTWLVSALLVNKPYWRFVTPK